MKIAIKEANETLYWLVICERSENYPKNSSLKPLAEELVRIISKIMLSSKLKALYVILLICVGFISTFITFSYFHIYYGSLYHEPHLKGVETKESKRKRTF